MAQPQGLNIPVIITTGIVGTILTMAIIEGVLAYYNHYSYGEEARRWTEVRYQSVEALKADQQKNLGPDRTSIPIEEAMTRVVASGGKRPSTQPATN